MKKKNAIVVILGLLIGIFAPMISGEVTAASDPMVIVIDPGHGGYDSGAVSAGGILEKDVNLTISKYIEEELSEYANVEVYLTRSTDVYLTLSERTEIADDYDADLFISIHANSSTSTSAKGAEVYYQNSNYISNYDSVVSYTQLKSLATNIQAELVSLGLYDRGILIKNSTSFTYPDGTTADYYSVLCDSKEYGIPALLVEHAFLSNTSDVSTYLSSNAKLKTLALADVEAIVETLGLKKVSMELVITAPDTTTYVVGDGLDTTGLTATAKYSDGTTIELTSSQYSVSGFSSTTTGNKVVTVSYDGESAKFVACVLAKGSDVNGITIGDVNGDSSINATDYLLIKDYILGDIVLSDAQIYRADVKEDSEIKASDYLMIKDYILGVLESLREAIVEADEIVEEDSIIVTEEPIVEQNTQEEMVDEALENESENVVEGEMENDELAVNPDGNDTEELSDITSSAPEVE